MTPWKLKCHSGIKKTKMKTENESITVEFVCLFVRHTSQFVYFKRPCQLIQT